MKYVILVPDGMADVPVDELNGRTCMEAADIQNMDLLAKSGVVGTVSNVPKNMIPASDVANLSIIGYNPEKYYCGRGPFEAANLGIPVEENEVIFRYNAVTIDDGKMIDYSAGHISTKESNVLAKTLNSELGSEKYSFYPGFSYRNLLKVKCSTAEESNRLAGVKCAPPHDILDKDVAKYLPKDKELVRLINNSIDILKHHEINKVRVDLGQNPANAIWMWGQGKTPQMPLFKEAFGITGAIISAVDLIKGMGKILGLEVVDVPGATGYYDTNYEGKAEAAINALESKDMVFVHVEAPDEAGHNGDIRAKITAIENFDKRILKTIYNSIKDKYDYRILLLPDHPTPVKLRTHTAGPVPFTMAGKGIVADEVTVFSENSASAGSLKIQNGHELMKRFLS